MTRTRHLLCCRRTAQLEARLEREEHALPLARPLETRRLSINTTGDPLWQRLTPTALLKAWVKECSNISYLRLSHGNKGFE